MLPETGADRDGLRVHSQPGPPAGWDGLLLADPGSSPSHRAGVAEAFAAVLPGYAAEYLVATDADGLAGGISMCVSRLAGAEWLHAMPLMLPGAPVARPARRDAVDFALAAALAERAAAPFTAGGEWVCYRPGAPVAAAEVERPAGETRHFAAAVIELAGAGVRRWEVDRRERKQLRRAERAGLACEEDPGALDECYALHLTQARRWPGHRPYPLALMRRLLAAPQAGVEPLARLFTARNGRRLLCGIFALDHAHETFAWWSGTHPDAREVAAARALLVWSVEWAAMRGRARFNLGASAGLAGVASFKQSLGTIEIDYPVRWFVSTRGAAHVRLLAALQRRARRGRHVGDSL